MPQLPPMAVADPARVANSLQSGDLVLFSGQGLASDVVRVFTRSVWSHIGMVVRVRGIDQPLLLESTNLSESRDVLQGRPVRGIALVPFVDKVRDYQGEVALRRRLGNPLSPARQRMLERLALRLCHRPYKNYVLCHVRGWLAGYPCKDYSAMFCSELVAELYRRLGWLRPDVIPRNFVPGDFAAQTLSLRDGELDALLHLRAHVSGAVTAVVPLRKDNIARLAAVRA